MRSQPSGVCSGGAPPPIHAYSPPYSWLGPGVVVSHCGQGTHVASGGVEGTKGDPDAGSRIAHAAWVVVLVVEGTVQERQGLPTVRPAHRVREQSAVFVAVVVEIGAVGGTAQID